MRALPLLFVLLLCEPALAQVTVDPGALEPLSPPAKPAAKKPVHAKPAPRTTKPTTAPKPAAAPKPPAVPAAPPPGPVLPPPIVVPTRPVPPPPPVPVVPQAKGEATRTTDGGLRLTFGSGSADLNPSTDEALRTLAHAYPPFDTTLFTVTAYAAGTADDPSTPRRLSLSRALAARAVLIAEGVTSVRIFVRALGANAPTAADGPPDRVDVTVTTAAPPKP